MPPAHHPTHDRVSEDLVGGAPAWLRADMAAIVGEAEVHGRLIDLVRYATDASPYRMIPKIIITPHTVEEVAQIFAYAHSKNISVTIRASGSSLSGQAQGDGIMIDARKHWAGTRVLDSGRRLHVRPGTVMFRANLALASYGFRLGPDPASYSVATVGGVIANNSSGMCCGTVQNSYKTLESLAFLLPSGTRINTADSDAEATFDREITIDSREVGPQITWGTSPQQVMSVAGRIPDPAQESDPDKRTAMLEALTYMGLSPGQTLEGLPVDWVFIGSCTNGRIEDLRAAAQVVGDRKVAPGVQAWVVPGSQQVQQQAEAEGLGKAFRAAGFQWREPGCSMCLAANGETVPRGKRSVSTTNRNFEGRQGPQARTHLASPAMAAAAALTGRITDIRKLMS